jgi:hypothetical protein
MALVTLDDAKRHLGLEGINDRDAIVTQKMEEASAIVLKHVKAKDPVWTVADVPFDVKAAVKLVLYDLYYLPGGAGEPDSVLSQTVLNLLRGYRDPTLA